MLSEIGKERQILYNICMWNSNKQTHRNRIEEWLLGCGANRERFVKGYRLSAKR